MTWSPIKFRCSAYDLFFIVGPDFLICSKSLSTVKFETSIFGSITNMWLKWLNVPKMILAFVYHVNTNQHYESKKNYTLKCGFPRMYPFTF